MSKPNTLIVADGLWHIRTKNGQFIQTGQVKWEETLCGIFIRMEMRDHNAPLCETCVAKAQTEWGVQIVGRTRKPWFQTKLKRISYTVPQCVRPAKPKNEPTRITETVMKVQS